jgi:hypothetical protein
MALKIKFIFELQVVIPCGVFVHHQFALEFNGQNRGENGS